MAVITLTKENFQNEIDSGKVLIDFWASWCGPCKALSPIVDQVSDEVSDVKICKLNVDEQPEIASKYNVMSIPTLIVLENGIEVNKSVGLVSKEKVLGLIGK